jgi:hypothetical protein
MSNAAHRRNTLLVSTAGAPAWAASYTVTAYEPGGQVTSDSTGTTLTVRAGHGFAAGDKLMVGTDTTKYRTISGTPAATSVVVTSAVTVSAHDYLVNLAADTGTTTPLYDGSGVSTARRIYQDMDLAGTTITNAQVTADAQGVYSYWYDDGLEIWELVRNTAGTPVAVIPGIRDIANDPIIYGDTSITTANGGVWKLGHLSENLTLSTSGTTTNTSASLLPANSIIEAVVAYVTTGITVATDWKLGDSTQAARFTAAQTGLIAGSTVVGLNHVDPTVATANLGPVQTSAATVRVTTTGTPGAGAIRITSFFRSFTAPTS